MERERSEKAMMRAGGACAAVLLLFFPGLADAAGVQLEQQQAFARWHLQDKCIADAVTANPNRDLASQRKRDKFVDTCMASHDLPPRAHLLPDAPPGSHPPDTHAADAHAGDAHSPDAHPANAAPPSMAKPN